MNEPRQTGNSSVSEWGNGSGDNGYSWNYINTLNKTFIDTVRNQGSAADTDGDGYINVNDLVLLQQHLVGKDVELTYYKG